jgi:outer membrane immunogenic protein
MHYRIRIILGDPMKSMKLALLGATALVAAGALSTANAADVYARGGSLKDGPVDYMPAITWSGFYFGINAGGAFNANDNNGGDDDDDTIFIGGVHLGYNWQRVDNIVLGLEGDVDFADDIDYLATIRGRLGYAAGPTLFYATGGVAFLGPDDSNNGFDNDDDDNLTGWVVGGGIEHKIRENVSVGVEGLYYAFDDDNNDFGGDDETNFWTVRARLTYHFGRQDEPLK